MSNGPKAGKREVEKRTACELQLVFPELMDTTEHWDECIVEFIRRSPKYVFPYRINQQFDTPGDAA